MEPLTTETHAVGRAPAARYGLSVHDSMIVAAALLAGCTTLLSEEMGEDMMVEGRLRISNPFKT